MLVLNKKINNRFGWLFLVFLFISAAFLFYLKESIPAVATVSPSGVSRLNIFPEAFDAAGDETDLSWQNAAAAFSNDLSESAAIGEFDRNNSAYLAGPGEGTAAASKSGESEAAASESSGGVDAAPPDGDGQSGEMPADAAPPDMPAAEPGSPPQPDSGSGATLGPDPTGSGPEEAGEQASGTVSLRPGGQTINVITRLGIWRRYLGSLVELFSRLKTAKAEETSAPVRSGSEEPAAATGGQSEAASAGDEKVPAQREYPIIFKNFGIPEDFESENITNVQLRLSLAARSGNIKDKVRFSYGLGEDWQEASVLGLDQDLANETNGGYFLFALPAFKSSAEFDKLEIKVNFEEDLTNALGLAADQTEIFIDAVWLEVDYAAPAQEEIIAALEPEAQAEEAEIDQLKDGESSLELISREKIFRSSELPDFNFIYKRKKGFFGDLFSLILGAIWDQYEDIEIAASVIEAGGRPSRLGVNLDYIEDGEFHLRFKDSPKHFRPGRYSLEIRVKDGDRIHTQTQDFSWGVLALNTNKAIYLPDETAYLQMAVLDDNGNTICDADLFMEITAPDGGVAYLSTDNELINRSGRCGPNNVTDTPDYYAYYGLGAGGAYRVKLTARTKNGLKEIIDRFEAGEPKAFDLERIGPTRIYPLANYRMRLKIAANSAYAGPIYELVPGGFSVFAERVALNGVDLARGKDYRFDASGDRSDGQLLKWDGISLEKDDFLEISYEFDAPDASPEFYLLGPAKLGPFVEARSWQIASDAVTAYAATAGTSVNWTNPGNAWDPTNNTYASRDIPKNGADDSANYLKATANGASDLGAPITKVEIGVEGYVQRTDTSVYLAPILDGTATGSAQLVSGASLGTIDSDNTFYVDVTSATSSWTWTDVINLDVLAYGVNTFNANKTLFIDQIRIRVTYASPPTGLFNSAAQKTDGSGVADISIEANDGEGDNTRAKLEYVAGSSCNFASSSDPTIDTADPSITADFGDPEADNLSPYQIGTTTGWILTASGTNTVDFDWDSKTDLPAADGTYCLRLTVNDGTADQTAPATTTLILDNVTPTAPGSLTAATSSNGNGVVLTFGAAGSDTNFKEYKIFYKPGAAGLTESDQAWGVLDDANLGYADYNGATSTTLNDLIPKTQYVFSIWIYDQYGNRASSSEITFTTGKAAPLRGNTVLFLGGQYSSSDGITGRQSDTNQTLPAFDLYLAESGAKIKNAYVMFDVYFESYINTAGNYTGHKLAFDACQKPCSANAWSGTGNVSVYDTSVLAYDETAGNLARLLLDVTQETQLATYGGGGQGLSAQIGYNIERGTATNSISAAKAVLAVTYEYDESQTSSFTNTVIYPLESLEAGDSGSRRNVQADNCTVDVNCPKFSYSMNLPEFKSRLSQWFKTYNQNDGNTIDDLAVNVNVEGTDIDSSTHIHESALGGSEGATPVLYFSGVSGFAENTAQQIEYHGTSLGGTLTYYLLGGEAAETYTASTSAPLKTRTVAFPLGVVNNGLSTAKSSATTTVYFPENGMATGTVSVKKAWFRVITNNYNTAANTITVSTKAGSRAESSGYIYNYNQSGTSPKPSFNIIHLIPAADYAELESANASTSKTVSVYTQNSNGASQGGTSAELVITYTYSDESAGHLAALNIFAGQTASSPTSTATTSIIRLVSPEPPGNKSMLAGGLLASYFLSAGNYAMPGANLTLGASLATGTPVCANAHNSRPDSVNAFSEYYMDTLAVMTAANRERYTACYSTDGGGNATVGAKMNGVLSYVYRWGAPPVQYQQNDWRWFDNADGLAPGAAKADENTAISNVNIADSLRLRLNLSVLAEKAGTSTQTFKLQYAAGSDCAAIASSSWVAVGTSTESAIWRGFDNPAVTDGSSSASTLLFSSDKFESYEEDNPTVPNPRSLDEGESGEWDWVVYNNGASSSADYCFRLVKSDDTVLDDYAGYPRLTTAASNTPPANPNLLGQFLQNGTTTIANQAWIREDGVQLVGRSTDVNINQSLALYYELIADGAAFTTSTSAPASWCVFGTAYASCAPKIWAATSTIGDWRINPFIGTTSITVLPQDYAGYKWQVLACDDLSACSAWTKPGPNPNFKVDLTPPGPPGNLSEGDKTPTSISLIFGSSTDETNFSRYRIFYKQGSSGVRESDSEKTDANLWFSDYNGATSTLVSSLSAGTQYVFNIWAYDLAGNKASSSIELVATTASSFTPPTGALNTATQETDGSGAINIFITADDPDNDDTLRAKLEYEAGSSCSFASSSKATIDPADASTYTADPPVFGDPKVDNLADYQVGTTTGWIKTSPGANFVFFDWLSGTDLPGVYGTYCLRLTVNDGLFDQATSSTKLILVDNLAPTAPGALTLSKKDHSSLTVAFGSQSTDASFDRYRIFYSTSSPVTVLDAEHLDSNLNFINYNGAATTTIGGLIPDTLYYLNIWAYDDFGNLASSTQLATKTNALPYNLVSLGQFKSDEVTVIANGGWITENQVRLRASANDPDASELLTLYFEFIASSSAFRTATTVPSGACVYGAAYNSCASKVWFVASSSPGDWSVTPYTATSSITGIPDSSSGYKWQVMACDDDGSCSDWLPFNLSSPNVKVDTAPPSAPGALTLSSKTSTSITLSFGSTTSETNFDRYRIFYSTSTPVTATSTEHPDANLLFQNYNGASLTTIYTLAPNTQYYFNIFAYDQAGQVASSSETAVTTNSVQSTPGVAFYTKNTRVLYYKVWNGSGWGGEQSGPTLGSGAGDNIRQIESIASDDRGKVAVLAKTWDGANQEWWATVYRVAANNFATSTQLGAAQANANYNNLITGCMASLSGGEFFIIRNNNAANGTLVYSWDPAVGWTSEGAGPNPVAVLTGCRLVRRPGTDNYLLTTFDAAADVGSSYYFGGSTYAGSWTIWTEHSTNESNVNNFVGEGFFDPGDNSRGAFNYSNSATNAYTYAKNFVAASSSIAYGSASSSPQSAPGSWGGAYVQGEFSADPGNTGLAYFAGRDAADEINIYRIDISAGQPAWATAVNGDNISAGQLYQETSYSQKPFSLAFYEYYNALVVWNTNAAGTPKYQKINSTSNSVDSASSSVPNAASDVWTRVRLYDDPNEDELLAVYQNDNIDYAAVFWSGAGDQFYGSGSQAWTMLATSTGAASANDQAAAFSFTGRNSPPNTPTGLAQLKSDASTTLANGAWASTSQLYFQGSATDPDTSEVVTLYVELTTTGGTFTSSTSQPTGACVWGTAYNDCASKIWFVASSSPGDYSSASFTEKVGITGIPDSATGYKWQLIACDDEAACSNWVKFNLTTPNFRLDATPPTAPGSLSIIAKNSASVTLDFGSQTTETNFSTYRIFYKAGASGVTEADSEHADADLAFINYNGTATTTVPGLASSTQYVFNIWAYDQAGNKASSSPEVSTTTNPGPNLRQTSYLLENDDGANVNANSAEGAASTSLSNLNKGERLDVRIQLENIGGDIAENKIYKLQFENQTDSPGTWTDVTNSSEVAFGLGLSGSSGDTITSAKAAPNGNTWTNGFWYEGTGASGGFSLAINYYTELVFAVRTNNALLGKTYRLRLYDDAGSRPLDAYVNYPTFSITSNETKRYSKGLYPSLPASSADLTYYFDPEGYADAAADDNSDRDALTSAANYPVVNFVTKNATNSQAITATWNGQSSAAATSAAVYLQVFRFGSTNAWQTVASNATSAASSDFTLSGNINSALAEYYDASNWTYWRVYQVAGSETLETDYFNASFSAPVPVVSQKHYRWRDDDGSEAAATWLEAEDVGSPTASSSLVKGKNIRLRLSAANTGAGVAANYAYRLEYATTTSNCSSDPGGWTTVPTDDSQAFRMASTTNFNDQASTTAQLLNSEGYSFVTGRMVKDPSSQTASTSLAENRYTEAEYVFYATAGAADGNTYCFRLTNASTALNAYDRYAELTLAGNPNTAPAFSVNPSDDGSATSTPTSFGDNVTFSATAIDPENDNYYLAVCQTGSITPGNDGPPVCNGGSWCISGLASSTAEATCDYNAATSSETLNWHAFVCDKWAGVGVAKCSAASQGGWGDDNDSPFNINHRPTFTSIITQNDNQDPGSTFNIVTVSADTDTAGGADTLYLYVCRVDSASFSGCSGGAGNTVCQILATSSPNAACAYADTAPTPATTTVYYGFIYDNHGLAASANSASSSYTINNVAPTLGSLVLNNGQPITLNIKGAPDKLVQTINSSVTDPNGCDTGLVSAVASVYMSNVSGGYNCTADTNDCYQIGVSGCVKSACSGDDDSTATITCSADLKYYAVPTDNTAPGNPWEPYTWTSRIQVYDGANYVATGSAAVELATGRALDVNEAWIDFGSNLFAGQNTGSVNQTTTVMNISNSPVDTNLAGIDMSGIPSGTLAVGNQEWNLTGFTWASGTDLTLAGEDVDIGIKRATSSNDSFKYVYWGIGIPFGSDSSVYEGRNEFTPISDPDGW